MLNTTIKSKIIDSHQHFWIYEKESQDWITEEMQVIRKNFLPNDLKDILLENGVDGCISVQADQTEKETNFLLDLASKNDFIKGVVGWVDLRSPAIDEKLSDYKSHAKLKGFRHVLQAEEPAFMLQPDFKRGIEKLGKYGYTYDLLIFPKHIPASVELVKLFPDQLFIVDHLAKPPIKHQGMNEWKIQMKQLAAFPNVYCKISGMVTEADWLQWELKNFTPYLDAVVALFGMKRLLFGSDWPVCKVAASYQEILKIVRNYFNDFSMEEQADFFGNNAVHFYQI